MAVVLGASVVATAYFWWAVVPVLRAMGPPDAEHFEGVAAAMTHPAIYGSLPVAHAAGAAAAIRRRRRDGPGARSAMLITALTGILVAVAALRWLGGVTPTP